MGTTEESEAPEEGKEKKSKFDFHKHVESGKKWAATAVVTAAFLQSLYASYIKEEDEEVAKDNYAIQTEALEEFSNGVDVQMAEMTGRLKTLETVCIGVLQPKASEPEVAKKKRVPKKVTRPVRAPAPPPGDPLMSMEPDLEPELPPLPARPQVQMQQQKSLKVRLPDAPWDKKEKK